MTSGYRDGVIFSIFFFYFPFPILDVGEFTGVCIMIWYRVFGDHGLLAALIWQVVKEGIWARWWT